MARRSEPSKNWTGPFDEFIVLTTLIVERSGLAPPVSFSPEASASTTIVPVELRPSTVPFSTLHDSQGVFGGSTAVHRTGADGSMSPLVSRTCTVPLFVFVRFVLTTVIETSVLDPETATAGFCRHLLVVGSRH
jgi:hypothetical protein